MQCILGIVGERKAFSLCIYNKTYHIIFCGCYQSHSNNTKGTLRLLVLGGIGFCLCGICLMNIWLHGLLPGGTWLLKPTFVPDILYYILLNSSISTHVRLSVLCFMHLR